MFLQSFLRLSIISKVKVKIDLYQGILDIIVVQRHILCGPPQKAVIELENKDYRLLKKRQNIYKKKFKVRLGNWKENQLIMVRFLVDKSQWWRWPSGLGSWFKLTWTDHCSLSPIWCEFGLHFVPYKKRVGSTHIARDKFYQFPDQGPWFFLGIQLPPPVKLMAAIWLKYC